MAGFQIGDILANLGIDVGGLRQQLATARSEVQRAASQMTRSLEGLASPRVFSGLAAGIRGAIGQFRSLFSSIVSIRSALVTVAGVKIFQRAGEVDNLRTAFDSLSKSIGALSDRFLARLRQATRGTVSDLELMRVTNNAILLDVAKTADQFVELTEAARRLGQATGRTTVQAIEDLALGIGRQSRLLLDNLGIIVKVGQAYEKYALSVGKTSAQLTQAEQRFAFQQEVFRAIRERIATLGPDVETVGQAVQRLGATISNTFSDIAQSIVSRRSVIGLADFLERQRPRIAAFVAFVRERLDQAIDAIITGFQRLRSGDLNIGEFLVATFSLAFNRIAQIVSVAIKNLVPVFLRAGALLGEQLISGFLAAIRKQQLALRAGIRSFFSATVDVPSQQRLARRAQEALDSTFRAFATLSRERILPPGELDQISSDLTRFGIIASDALEGRKQVTEQLLDDILTLQARLENAVNQPSITQSQKEFARTLDVAFSETGKAIESVLSGSQDDFAKFTGVLTGDIPKAAEKGAQALGRFRERLRDPLAGFRPLQTDQLVQPLANAVNKVVELREKFLLEAGRFVPDAVVKASAIPIQGLVNLVDRAGSAVKKLREAFKPRGLDEQAFLDIFTKLEAKLQELDFDRLTAGASAGGLAVAELNKAFDGLFEQMSDVQLAKVARLRAQLQGLASVTEAARAVSDLRESLASLGETQGETIARGIRRSIGEIQLSEAFSFDIEALQAQIRLSEAFKKDDPAISDRLEILQNKLRAALDARESIAELQKQLQDALDIEGRIRFEVLTKDVSTSILSGIVEGFERGESAAKVWANVVSDIFRQSMQRVIDQLTTQISKALGSVFQNLGLGIGAADLATGLLGIGSSILVGLRNRRDATVSDFSQQINSSEAIRGVVAGPTNVAIAKVGDQLKAALRTTEILLTRIAVSVERGGGGGTGTGGQFFMTRMTPSTPS